MTFLELLALIYEYLQIWGVLTILGLIALDIVLGIFAAIKRGEFQWDKVSQFYKTMIIPYVGGYILMQIGIALLPELGDLLDAMLPAGFLALIFLAIVNNLRASILDHLKFVFEWLKANGEP